MILDKIKARGEEMAPLEGHDRLQYLIDIAREVPPLDDKDKIDENKIRDKALILIGFAGGFRRSELVSILNEDIEFVPEGLKILIRRSKTDQSGEGVIKAIPYFDNKEFCPPDRMFY